MSISNTARRIATLAIVALGISAAAGSASASDCYYQPVRYKTVVEYVVRSVPYTEWVVRYDHCGVPYRVSHTSYRTVRVPVEKIVAVIN